MNSRAKRRASDLSTREAAAMSRRVELVTGGVRVAIAGDTTREALIDQARKLYEGGGERLQHMPHDELGAEMLAVADALTIYLHGRAAREALAAGVEGLDILDHHARAEAEARIAEAAADEIAAEVPVHVGRPSLRTSWQASPEAEATLAELLDIEEGGE